MTKFGSIVLTRCLFTGPPIRSTQTKRVSPTTTLHLLKQATAMIFTLTAISS